jgi:hypothetical protein
MQAASTRFVNALAGPHDIALQVDIRPQFGGDVLDSLPISTGSVTEDSTQAIRRTCTLTFPDRTGKYVPAYATDLLHPDSGNELHVFRGITFPDGSRELIPLGVFGLTKPTSTDTANGLSLQLGGSDRSHVVARALWVDPYPLTAGALLSTAIQQAIDSRRPYLRYNLLPTGDLVPAGVALGLNSSTDPWKEITGLETSAGGELLFDPQGVVVSRSRPGPGQAPVATFTEGVGGTLVQVVRDHDGDRGYNGVIVTAQVVAGSPPIRSVLWFTPSGQQPVPARPYIPPPSPTITTQAQADAAAAGLRNSTFGAAEEVTFTAVPDPRLNAGDTITLTRLRSKVASNFIVQAVTMPLDLTSPMSVTCVPRQGQ